MIEVELDIIAYRQLYELNKWHALERMKAHQNFQRILHDIELERHYNIAEIFKQFNERKKKVPKIIKTPWGVLFA